MLSFEEFGQQDFFAAGQEHTSVNEVPSHLILGQPGYAEITVAIPTYKRVHLLREALESVLGQTDPDFKVVITDNEVHANNETELYLKELGDPRIVYYRNEENIGALSNFNRCITLSECAYCIMLCADDLLAQDFIEKCRKTLRVHPEIDVLMPEKDIIYNDQRTKMKGYSSALRFLKALTGKDYLMRLHLSDFIMYYPTGGPSGIVYRSESFKRMGGFNPLWHPTGDYMLHARMAEELNTYLTTIDSGDYRMVENISLQSDMRSIYMIQKSLFLEYLIRKERAGSFWRRYYRGGVSYRLKRKSNESLGKYYDMNLISGNLGEGSAFDFIAFLAAWAFQMLRLTVRVRKLEGK